MSGVLIGLLVGFAGGAVGMMFVMNDVIQGWIDRWARANLRVDEMSRRAKAAEEQIARIRAAIGADAAPP